MKLVRFYKSDKYNGKTVIQLSDTSVLTDELTGITYNSSKHYHYIYLGNKFLAKYIGEEVDLTLVKSPTLNIDVCVDIKIKSEEPAEADLADLI